MAEEGKSKIEAREITEELRQSYLDYAMSVIVGRALPDVRDGLKPVHRRILWAMWEDGLTPGAKFRKSATVVGSTLGRYHPHGDTAVYDALARMAQDFSLRYPLITGQGNFGCFTSDTKVRLTDGRSLSFKELIEEHKQGKKNYTYTFNPKTQKVEVAAINRPRLTRRGERIMKVILDNGAEINCTLNHKFMLRDGAYKEAQDLKSGDSLMPGYFRISTATDDPQSIGYLMFHQPVTKKWEWVHRLADEWNVSQKVYPRSAGRVRHHKDFNKLNNSPENIERMHFGEHFKLHAKTVSWRHKNDPNYVEKLARGRARYIEENKEVFRERAKKLNQKLWGNKEFRERHSERIKALWSDQEYREKMRIISRQNLTKKWSDQAYRKLMSRLKSKEMKARWKDPEYRAYWSEKTRETSNKLWQDEGHREYISRIQRERTNDPVWRERQSRISKALWRDPKYRAKYPADHFSIMTRKLWANPKIKEFHSTRAKEQWQDPEFRKKITRSTRARNLERQKQNPNFMRDLTERSKVALKENWQNPEYKKQVVSSRILRYARLLYDKYGEINPVLYEKERVNIGALGTPSLEKTLSYFRDFEEIKEKAPLYNHKVARVEFLDKREDVFDLTIDVTHNFLLDAGAFVHNSVDGDSPAAQRYTEVKLSPIAEELLVDIDKDTVDFVSNYDDSRKEPAVLPAKFPNLLLNGSDGIAVGMATKIPPHNLGEVAAATVHLIDNPKAISEDLMNFIQGPDFPTGGVIYDKKAITEAYIAGRGAITARGAAEIEEKKIVITEIPYQVNRAELIIRIAELVEEKRIDGIRDIRDESTKESRIVIELKNDAVPQKVLNQLWRYTDLQKDFHLNMVALSEGLQPETLSIRNVLVGFIEHRKAVVTRRTKFELTRAEERAHILEGLAKALSQIDKVIATIKKSADREEAHARLMKQFALSDKQSTAILEMRLQTLAALERKKIEDELKEKLKLIKDLQLLLKSSEKILEVIKSELRDLEKRFGDPRRTKVQSGKLRELVAEDIIPEEEVVITMSSDGYIKRLSPATFKAQRRGGKGLKGSTLGETDLLAHFIAARTHDNILFFTAKGRVFQTRVYEIPAGSRTSKGQAIHNFLGVPVNEKVSALVAYPNKENGLENYLAMVTAQGMVKKTDLQKFSNVRKSGIVAIGLGKGDELKWAKLAHKGDEIILTTALGRAIRFKAGEIRVMGRTAAGVKGISLKKGDSLSAFDVVDPKHIDKTTYLLVVMDQGYAKQSPLKDYKLQRRGGQGILTAKITKKTGLLVSSHVIIEAAELLALSAKGLVLKTSLKSVRRAGRATQGVRIMRLASGDKIIGTVCL